MGSWDQGRYGKRHMCADSQIVITSSHSALAIFENNICYCGGAEGIFYFFFKTCSSTSVMISASVALVGP